MIFTHHDYEGEGRIGGVAWSASQITCLPARHPPPVRLGNADNAWDKDSMNLWIRIRIWIMKSIRIHNPGINCK
jgi:hypothetical protein